MTAETIAAPAVIRFQYNISKSIILFGLGRLGQIFFFQNFTGKNLKIKFLSKVCSLTLNALTT